MTITIFFLHMKGLNCSARGISDVVLECEDIGSAATVLCSFDTGPQHSCKLISSYNCIVI